MSTLPWRTLVIAATALLLAATPGASTTLMLDRDAVNAGEAWRLLTGHLVHGGGYHLAWDVAALVVIGFLFESVLRRRLWSLLLLSAAIVGAGVLLFEPTMTGYLGLSGVLNGLWVGGALLAARHELKRGHRLLARVYQGCVVAGALKNLESLTGTSGQSRFDR